MKACLFHATIITLLVLSCEMKSTSEPQKSAEIPSNMTTERMEELRWMNDPTSFDVKDGSLQVTVLKGTDFFNNPEDSSVVGSAPFLYQEVAGDFVAKAVVQPDFSAQWNALSMMVYLDSLNWIKFAFENSDATGPSIVTVVTKGTSDDANGVILDSTSTVWLAIARKGNIYSMHWSTDGDTYQMARLTSIRPHQSVKIGIEAQSPVGESATHLIHYFELVDKTVGNLRDINDKKE